MHIPGRTGWHASFCYDPTQHALHCTSIWQLITGACARYATYLNATVKIYDLPNWLLFALALRLFAIWTRWLLKRDHYTNKLVALKSRLANSQHCVSIHIPVTTTDRYKCQLKPGLIDEDRTLINKILLLLICHKKRLLKTQIHQSKFIDHQTRKGVFIGWA